MLRVAAAKGHLRKSRSYNLDIRQHCKLCRAGKRSPYLSINTVAAASYRLKAALGKSDGPNRAGCCLQAASPRALLPRCQRRKIWRGSLLLTMRKASCSAISRWAAAAKPLPASPPPRPFCRSDPCLHRLPESRVLFPTDRSSVCGCSSCSHMRAIVKNQPRSVTSHLT